MTLGGVARGDVAGSVTLGGLVMGRGIRLETGGGSAWHPQIKITPSSQARGRSAGGQCASVMAP